MTAFFTENMELIAQIIGFIAMFTAFLTYQLNKHKTIMIVLVIVASLWCVHFALLGQYTAVALNAVNVIRCVIYSFRYKRWAQYNFIPLIFIVISAIMTAVTWEGFLSLLPFFGCVFVTLANWQVNTKKLKLMTIPVCLCWFVYNFSCGSWAGMINETIAFTSIIISLVKDRVKNKKSE